MGGNRLNHLLSAVTRPRAALVAAALPIAVVVAACSGSGRSAPPRSAPTNAAVLATVSATEAAATTTPIASATSAAERLRAQATGTPVPGTSQATPAANRKGKRGDQAAQTLTLDDVLRGLKRRGLPVGTTTNLTAATDPDGLLGTAAEYTARLLFADTSLGTPRGNPTVDDGGAIEVFANAKDAARARQTLTASGATITVYQKGNVVLLLSSRLSADQVSSYEIALKQAFKTARKQAIRAGVQQGQQSATPTPTPAAP